MRHRVGLAVGFALVIVAFVWTAIDATHAAEFVERWIPKWVEPMITPTFNLVVILVGFLLVGAAWLELRFGGYKHDPSSPQIHPGSANSAEANSQQTFSPVLAQTASPLMTQNTYIDGKLIGEQSRNETTEVRPRPKSNLKCLLSTGKGQGRSRFRFYK